MFFMPKLYVHKRLCMTPHQPSAKHGRSSTPPQEHTAPTGFFASPDQQLTS